jgi:hypothetical protein
MAFKADSSFLEWLVRDCFWALSSLPKMLGMARKPVEMKKIKEMIRLRLSLGTWRGLPSHPRSVARRFHNIWPESSPPS